MESASLPEYSIDQIKQNDGENGRPLWIIIKNEVYDVTNFSHPGGREAFLDDHGEDRWEEFNSIHNKATQKQAEKYKIGKVKSDIPARSEVKKEEISNANKGQVKSTEKGKEKNEKRSVLIPFIVLFTFYVLFFKMNLLGIFNKNTNK